MKMTWILCQQQLSKGYFTGRNYNRSVPCFTKQIGKAIRFETEADAIRGKNAYIEEIKKNIIQHQDKIKDIGVFSKMTFPSIEKAQDYIYRSNFGGYQFRNYDSNIIKTAEQLIAEKSQRATNEQQRQIAELNQEIEYFDKKLFVREVPMGFRFMPREKREIKFTKNECNNYCMSCGGDIPDTMYLMSGWNVKICACCLSDMLPIIQKHVTELSPETKDLWEKERFLIGLA